MQEEWFAILKARVDESSRSAVARDLGYSTTAISLIMNGKYAGSTDKVSERVLEVYTRIACPYTGAEMPLMACMETANGKAPTHNPMKMAHWRACQNCPKRPKRE
ncbi:XRE family transcriptional regulator [Conchiformibius steedae]|uniref:XRE family transcriptional regulator n=2 Tax=Conchiformibius steedae TaxID=153493 RepID=A0A3P2A3T2_9NEIS|nr:XRE family transcriptional regulator [Conchiformibius steedae]